MVKYTTGELARLGNVSIRTIQYYHARGILVPESRTEGGRRLYSEEDVHRLQIICFLRELGFKLDETAQILSQENSREVLSLLMEQQRKSLVTEREKLNLKIEKVKQVQQTLQVLDSASVGDLAVHMKSKEKLSQFYLHLLWIGIPVNCLFWTSLIFWLLQGNWQFFVFSACLMMALIIWSLITFQHHVSYICPDCHEMFQGKTGEMFLASHSRYARRLTCPHCGYHGWCIEACEQEENVHDAI